MDDLERIADQAEYLTRAAKKLKSLYAESRDEGIASPSFREIEEAQRRLSSAFMAVIRVTSAYI